MTLRDAAIKVIGKAELGLLNYTPHPVRARHVDATLDIVAKFCEEKRRISKSWGFDETIDATYQDVIDACRKHLTEGKK